MHIYWERGAELPYAREYTCPQCWDSGQYPLGADDEAILSQMQRVPMQRAWAVERIAPQNDPLRADAEEIVDSHGGRALYVIFNLVNRLESLSLTDRERLIMNTLLLEVLDAACPLHNIDNPNSRPRQLTIPNRYKEANLWQVFQKSIDHWKAASPRIECTQYPQMPAGAGICFYSGRAKDLAKFTDLPEFKKVITVFPRPNQAFWSLSAVWASWLIGREAAASMAQVIARHRYDWTWHTIALASSLRSIPALLSSNARFVGLVPEIEPAFPGNRIPCHASSRISKSGNQSPS